MSQDRKLPDTLTVEFVDRMIQNFLEDADVLYHVLEADKHQSSFTLLGEVVNVTVNRKPYESAAGDILEKGKVKLAELQSVKGYVQDDKVVEEKSNEGEGEPTKELSEEDKAKISREASEVVEIKEQKIGVWWDINRNHWLWSGCVVSTKWGDLNDDEKGYIRELWNSFEGVIK